MKNLTEHLNKRKAFTQDENVRKAQRKEEINLKKQKRQEAYDSLHKNENENENQLDEDVQEKEKLSGAQKRENRAKLGTSLPDLFFLKFVFLILFHPFPILNCILTFSFIWAWFFFYLFL